MSNNYKKYRQKPEKKSRNKKIDPALNDSGWSVLKAWKEIPPKGKYALYEYPTKSGPVDYALIVDGNVIGLVEAKKENEEIYWVLTQAKRYARDLEKPSFDFEEFVKLYKQEPRKEQKDKERWKKFTLKDIKDKNFNLDIFWLKDDSLDSGEYEEPEIILENIKEGEEKILEEIDKITNILLNNGH